jgi:uncharacterized protein involved in exopolysaccharide biosynthesis
MKRYLRTFRRHKLLVIAPMVLALVVGLGYEVSSPRNYQAMGTLWADAPIPGNSTVYSQQQPNPTPSAQEAAVLSELLPTEQFLTQIGKRSPWAAYLARNPGAVDTVFASLGKNTTVSTLGPQVIQVAYQSSNQATTAPVAKAIVNAFAAELVSLQQQRDQQQITYDKATLQTTLSALNSAQKQLSEYMAAHPGAVGATTVDPTVTQLSGDVASAQTAYGTAVANLDSSQQSLSSAADSSQLHVIDEPTGTFAQGRKKKIVYGGIGGLFAGGVISILLLSWLVSRDTSPWDAEDLEDELGLTVVGSIDEVPAKRREGRAS